MWLPPPDRCCDLYPVVTVGLTRASIFSATSSAILVDSIMSTPKGMCGPCCSTAPTGMSMIGSFLISSR